ncbi:MAG TPA: hypothetical protein DD414_07850 [Lachnospiraceae bacterium]|nr:hypothetical protein [Lachnospiraceae bacterium]
MKKPVDLSRMYELKMTPERKVEAFRRYVIKLKTRKWGKSSRHYDYYKVDLSFFREEALYMKDLDVRYDVHVRISREIRCLEEMSDEQILCYYTLVKDFRKNVVGKVNMLYVKYYILELANLIYQDTPKDAFAAMLAFWDALNGDRKISDGMTEYFYAVCRLFMIAHTEMAKEMILLLEEKSGQDFSGRNFLKIEKGNYKEADQYVRQNARLLKEEEIYSQEDYIKHTWKAMPCVFRALEENLKPYDFRHVILNGFYASAYIPNYPMSKENTGDKKIVRVSRYVYFERQSYSDYWRYWYYILRESVQDLLNLIHLYTESYMREYFLVKKKRKRSSARILNKAYMGGADRIQDVEVLKSMVADERFEAAIQKGVLAYLEASRIKLPQQKKKSAVRKAIEDMDYGDRAPDAAVDHERLKKAREDARSVLSMLQEGEIDYEDREELTEEIQPAKPSEQVPDEPVWTRAEREYVGFLCREEQEQAKVYLKAVKMPENIMIKTINEKALALLGDILLEKEGGEIRVLEEYREEAAEFASQP